MMKLTARQRKNVEENMNLVHRVIRDRVHGEKQWGIHTYEDLFQIGCIGLCKAAATDKGGTFSTYAYRLIWHEINRALAYAARQWREEAVADVTPYMEKELWFGGDVELRMDLEGMMTSAKRQASSSAAKGMDAMILMTYGYTSREIGEWMGVAANHVCAYVSRARNYLRNLAEAKAVAGYC